MAVALGGVAWFAWPRGFYVRSHVRWIWRASVAFAAPALIGLAALGRGSALVRLPVEFAPVAAQLPRMSAAALAPAIAVGMAVGGALVWARIAWARRHGRPLARRFVMPAPLAAHAPGELLPAIAVALAAGVTEELAFRLNLPLLLTIVGGNAWFGFGIATLIFVALHRYQRLLGLIGVGLIGLLLAGCYVATGSLLLVIAVHAATDVMALAVRPWLAGFGRAGLPRRQT